MTQKPIIKTINIMASPTVDISDKEETIKAFLAEYRIKEWKPEYTAVVLEYKHLPKSALIKLLQRCYPDYPLPLCTGSRSGSPCMRTPYCPDP